MTPGRGGFDPHPDRELPDGQRWKNLTVQVCWPMDEACLKVLMARYEGRDGRPCNSYSRAARLAIREAAGMEEE